MYSERTGTPSKQTIASTVMAIACGFAEANFGQRCLMFQVVQGGRPSSIIWAITIAEERASCGF